MNVLTLFIWYSIINLIVYLISIKLSMVLTNELRNLKFLHKFDIYYICYIPFINTVVITTNNNIIHNVLSNS